MVAADAAESEMNVQHIRKAAAQVPQQGRFARNAAEQQVFKSAADNGVENGVLALRDSSDFDDVALGWLAVILREFAKWPFQLTPLAAPVLR